MKIENMTSSNGNAVPNQFIIRDDEGNTWFQSYDSMIAVKRSNGKIELDSKTWDYSMTTGKYRNQFLCDATITETRKKIESGEYTLTNLN